MTPRRLLRAAGLAAGIATTAVAGAACTPALSVHTEAAGHATTPASPTTSASPSGTTAPAPAMGTTTRTGPPRTLDPTQRPATVTSRAAQRAPTAPRCHGIPSSVTAAQVVLVDGAGSGATVRACARVGGSYETQLGPWFGHVGRGGVSWSKHEGDLTTPAGTFPLRGGFGIDANPGLRGTWFTATTSDVWVDDTRSSLYNTHQRTPADGRWSAAEPLHQSPAYTYAQVIGYNEARTPGKGSAIFLHVDLGHGTAGCVSIPSAPLRTLMRWERPGALITIIP